jgi:DNA replication protein
MPTFGRGKSVSQMKSFVGFRNIKERQVVLPESFFTELMPLVDDLDELKVSLACWRILAAKAGTIRFVCWEDLVCDKALAGMEEKALRDGLERATLRGTLLRVQARDQEGEESWYFANTERGRAVVSAIQRGDLPDDVLPAEVEVSAERPNIFSLYEQTVGLLSPLIADELRDAEASYPPGWIEDAFREAARQNARSWAYVRKVLERRARGERKAVTRDGDVSDAWRRFLRGEG